MGDFVEDVAKDPGGELVFSGEMPPKIRVNAELSAGFSG